MNCQAGPRRYRWGCRRRWHRLRRAEQLRPVLQARGRPGARGSLPPRTAWRPNASLAAAHRAHVTWRPQRSGLIRSFITPARPGPAQM
ncbi:hypothetical protein ACPA9J_01585 [Pseudomonas aeruginosa]